MRNRETNYRLTLIPSLFAMAALLMATPAAAQVESILRNFGSNTRAGVNPDSALILDSAGNLYGTASFGGNENVGVVFELSPKAGGGYSEKVLHSFAKIGGDGQNPSNGLIFDSAGNLYGNTMAGGTSNQGTVFELSPPVLPSTQWTETILHSFGSGSSDGQDPRGTLVLDASGNLYGVTEEGGSGVVGTAYELSPAGGGAWTERIIHTFTTASGWLPSGGMIFDASGNLYGVTGFGGTGGDGVVFELSPAGGSSWTYDVLHNFAGGDDGSFPEGGLVFDSAGNLFGITAYGNPTSNGTVFELSPSSSGTWAETIIHAFAAPTDGATPNGAPVFNSAGALLGTTLGGGTGSCPETAACGIVFELHFASGAWHERILHNFNQNGTDGFFPTSGVVLDFAGNVYGSTEYGGTAGDGTVYSIRP